MKNNVDSTYKAKALSRTKYYNGEEFKNFTFRIPVHGKIVLVSITKGRNNELIYEVPNAKEQIRGRVTEHDLHVMYAQVTVMPDIRKGMNYSSYNRYQKSL
jgi:hypothetical protein